MIKINGIRSTLLSFYYNNLIGGNYDDTFGNTVTLESGIDGGGGGGMVLGLGVEMLPKTNYISIEHTLAF